MDFLLEHSYNHDVVLSPGLFCSQLQIIVSHLSLCLTQVMKQKKTKQQKILRFIAVKDCTCLVNRVHINYHKHINVAKHLLTIIYRLSWFTCCFLLPAKHFLELLGGYIDHMIGQSFELPLSSLSVLRHSNPYQLWKALVMNTGTRQGLPFWEKKTSICCALVLVYAVDQSLARAAYVVFWCWSMLVFPAGWSWCNSTKVV